MIFQGSQSVYIKILQLGYLLGFTPITWDFKNHCLKHSVSRLRNSWVKVQFGLEICYQLFLAYKSWLAFADPNVESRHKIRLLYVTALYTVLNVNHLINVFQGRDFVQLMNGFNGMVKEHLQNGKSILFRCAFRHYDR